MRPMDVIRTHLTGPPAQPQPLFLGGRAEQNSLSDERLLSGLRDRRRAQLPLTGLGHRLSHALAPIGAELNVCACHRHIDGWRRGVLKPPVVPVRAVGVPELHAPAAMSARAATYRGCGAVSRSVRYGSSRWNQPASDQS